uniref:Retrotransposon gag domain-containing protein n=1 Tax=Chromera velia CCMP2878 TaxID=1169474 RepID=A0A0G4GXB0_9ALVE|eukprot:Cvel_23716.t1-p1 / transcript=Cvel_23716.t1 / gene=Cvel_23716 / organism=Chromera_velia_CCMP2878 / gene_product=hypothetical protein / transcript_product=hypothetical protein / location=Cvel_scaffold2477:15654-16067(+) / protein_length=138 / sequence_SO=supercontig / SO=protein_coding / is_pseudo=false
MKAKSFWNWLMRLNERLGWTFENLRDIYLPTALTGPAKQWYKMQASERLEGCTTAAQLKEMFLTRYGIDEWEAECKKRMLLQITQNFRKSSPDYVIRFEEQCSAANQSTDDLTALGAFIEGIEDGKLRIQIETHTYST